MKNTLENQIAFKSQYFSYLIKEVKQKERIDGVNGYTIRIRDSKFNLEVYCKKPISLKLISEITNEDISYLYLDGVSSVSEYGYMDSKDKLTTWSASDMDYLRSKGYLLGWSEVTVNEAIEFGWVKLENASNNE